MAAPLDITALYAAHRPLVLRYLRRMVGEAEAEDVAQVVFERAGKALPSFRGECSPATWLYRIAANAALDLLRSPAFTRRDRGDEAPEEAEPAAWVERTPDSEQEAIRNEMNACIRGVVLGLPGNYATVLALCDLEGFPQAEAAARLGISLETLKIRLHRARARLRKELDRQCRFYRNDLNQLSCDRRPDSGPDS